MKKDTNFVALGKHVCPVCGQLHDSGEVLIHKRLMNIKPEQAVTGQSLCPEHKRLFDEGYLALVGVDESKSGPKKDTLRPEDAYRTGWVMHIQRHVAKRLFNVELPESLPMCFVAQGVIDMLEKQAKEQGAL